MADPIPGPVMTLEALYGFPPAWYDMTCDVYGLHYKRGKQTGGPSSWNVQVGAGELLVELDNSSGRYSAFSRDGDIALGEGTTLRLRCSWQGVHRSLFVGYVEDWKEDWTQEVDRVLITAVDPMGVLAEMGGAFDWVPGAAGQTVRARIEQLLGRAGVKGEPFYSQAGSVLCISPLLSNTTVLDEIQQTVLSDYGAFFHEPAPIVNIADVDPLNSWVYLNRSRFASVTAATGALTPHNVIRTDATDWRTVSGPYDRIVGAITRPAQTTVPTFSDACLEVGSAERGYTDIEWRYIAYERPSLVAVANRTPPQERDEFGALKPLPWQPASAQVAVSSARHRIVTLSDLRFSTADEAKALAASIATQLGQPKLEVSRLRLWPHRDVNDFTALLGLRLQDHVITVRNLVHGSLATRVEITSMIEGFDIKLTPRSSWSNGQHTAEWDVSLILSPIVADIDDVPIPPDIGETPAGLTLSPEGSSPSGVPPTGWINPSTLRLSYLTATAPATATVYAEVEDVVTLLRQAIGFVSRETNVAVGGNRGIADRFDGALMRYGAQYRARVVDGANTARQSNWVTINVPIPAPSTPTIVDYEAWRTATYSPTAGEATQTSLTWPVTPGVLYQIGIKEDHLAGEAYSAQPLQSGNLWVGALNNNVQYSIALRYNVGGVFSAWSPPLKVTMGQPAHITDNGYEQLGGAEGLVIGYNGDFKCEVPYVPPPANGPGDGQWAHTFKTHDWAYAGDPDGFVGTHVTELRLVCYNGDNVGPVGAQLCIPGYGITQAVMAWDIVWDIDNNTLSTTYPNPTWVTPEGFVKVPINYGVSQMNTVTDDTSFGLRLKGKGYLNYTANGGLKMRGAIFAWGTQYIAHARQRNVQVSP